MSRPVAALFGALLLACQPAVMTPAVPRPAVPTPREEVPAAPAGAQGAPIEEQRRFEIDVVDVGTGLAVLVQGPDFTLVYDGGSNDDVALGPKNRFLAYLRAVAPKRTTIDHMIVSHPHRDHVELLPDLFAAYTVRDVWDSGATNDICGYRRLLSAIAAAPAGQVRYHAAHGSAFEDGAGEGRRRLRFPPAPPSRSPRESCSADEIELPSGAPPKEGQTIPLGAGAAMTFLHVPEREHRDDLNEESLVVRLDLDGVRVLLSGDAEAGGRASPSAKATPKSIEGRLLAGRREELAADVWVIPHHGSSSSSRKATISAVHPKVSVISAGPTKYGAVVLPDAAVVAALAAVSAVYRTDLHDDSCPTNRAKIGPDNDGEPGGCDNVHLVVAGGKLTASYRTLSD